MSISTILFLLFLHWIGDFVLQSDYMAQNKGKNWWVLWQHVRTYSIIFLGGLWGLGGMCVESFRLGVWFMAVTITAHFIQDAITAPINGRLRAAGKNHLFFVAVGADQFLHFCQIILTYHFLTQ